MGALTQSRLQELLHYDPETGDFRWRVDRGKCTKAGDYAGSVQSSTGYLQIGIDYWVYFAHRLAWLYIHGEWPADQIDHINRDKLDNRIANLRQANRSQQGRNRPSRKLYPSGDDLKGVQRWYNRFRAQIKVEGRNIYLGTFDTAEEAHEAYKSAAIEHFGEWACFD
jgi:hypothetical protein